MHTFITEIRETLVPDRRRSSVRSPRSWSP